MNSDMEVVPVLLPNHTAAISALSPPRGIMKISVCIIYSPLFIECMAYVSVYYNNSVYCQSSLKGMNKYRLDHDQVIKYFQQSYFRIE